MFIGDRRLAKHEIRLTTSELQTPYIVNEGDSFDGPLHVIRHVGPDVSMSISELIKTTSSITKGDEPIMKHPNMGKMAMVSSSNMMQLAAKGLNTEIFGFINMKIFEHLDDALAYVRSSEE